MTELDEDMPETALELIEEYGTDCIYRKLTGTNYDIATGTAGQIEGALRFKAIVEDVLVKAGSGMVEGQYKKFTCPAMAFAERPTAKDFIGLYIEGGENLLFSIQDNGVKETNSGQRPVIYEIWAQAA